MTGGIENHKDDAGNRDTITQQPKSDKLKVSACGCDTDHHGGEYISTTYNDKRIYFCAESCKKEFLDDPETFLASDHFLLEFELLEDA